MLSIYRATGCLKLCVRKWEAGAFYHTVTSQTSGQSIPVWVSQWANREADDANVLLSADTT